MSVEVAYVQEKLMRAAKRAELSSFPGEIEPVFKAIIQLPNTELMDKLPEGARRWLLEELAKHPPITNKNVLDDQIEYKVWIVWKLNKDIPVLVAIDTSEKRAGQHVALVEEEARCLGNLKPETFVEESRLNHLYGQSVSDLKSFKVSVIMARNRKKRQ